MTFVIKTGMDAEADVVRKMLRARNADHWGIRVLSGVWPEGQYNQLLPCDTTAIISLGTCGGLCPGPSPVMPEIGSVYVASMLATPDGDYNPDVAWAGRLVTMLKCKYAAWWSSGKFNTADDVASRSTIFGLSGATIIDDESYGVAKFAKARNIPFAIMRVVSDTCRAEDDLPPAARNAIQQDGGFDIFEVLKSVLQDSGQIKALEHCYTDLQIALAKLRVALDALGPFCQFSR